MDIKEDCAFIARGFPCGFKCIRGFGGIVDETTGGLEGRASVCLAHTIVAVPSPGLDVSLHDGWH